MQRKENLRDHSDQELSLVVMNDEFLYSQRHKAGIIELLEMYFDYTDDQLEVLKQDLIDDLNESEG